jgi:hypothetical protein
VDQLADLLETNLRLAEAPPKLSFEIRVRAHCIRIALLTPFEKNILERETLEQALPFADLPDSYSILQNPFGEVAESV